MGDYWGAKGYVGLPSQIMGGGRASPPSSYAYGESGSFRSYSRSVRSFRLRPISGVSRFGPIGAGRFGPISKVGRFGPILVVSRFGLIYLFWENR